MAWNEVKHMSMHTVVDDDYVVRIACSLIIEYSMSEINRIESSHCINTCYIRISPAHITLQLNTTQHNTTHTHAHTKHRPKLLANLDKLHALAATTASARSAVSVTSEVGAGALGSSHGSSQGSGSGSASSLDQSGSGLGGSSPIRGLSASGTSDTIGSAEGAGGGRSASTVGNDESYHRLVEEDDGDGGVGTANFNTNTPADVVSAFEEIQRAVEGAGVVVGDGVDDIYYSRDFGDDEEEDGEDIGIEQMNEDGEEDDDEGDAEEEEDDGEDGGEHYGIDQDFEDNEEDEDDDDFDSRDDDEEGDQGDDREESGAEGRHPLDGGFEVRHRIRSCQFR